MSLERQRILITGGTRGIGRAISLRLAKERPAHIAMAYSMDHDSARATAEAVTAAGVPATVHATDVGQEEMLKQLFARVGEELGGIDILIHCAARASFRPAMEISSRTWHKTVEINAGAFLTGSQLAAKWMPNGGRIIGLSSLGSQFYVPGYAALGASKAMIESLARYLAVELAPQGINVNVVCGGLIDTTGVRRLPEFDRLASETVARTPARRLGSPEDIAGIVAFLCSPESDWIRGQTLVADGGYSLCL